VQTEVPARWVSPFIAALPPGRRYLVFLGQHTVTGAPIAPWDADSLFEVSGGRLRSLALDGPVRTTACRCRRRSEVCSPVYIRWGDVRMVEPTRPIARKCSS
jgi:hypothetical protein